MVSAEFIFRRGTPHDAEYTFKHALVRDAAYSTLLRSQRRQIHARVAMTVENLFPEVVTAHPTVLAHHCAEAGLAEKAVAFRLKAGQQAPARSAMLEAEESYRQGLAMLNTLPESPERDTGELELCSALVRVLQQTRGFPRRRRSRQARASESSPRRSETFACLFDRLDFLRVQRAFSLSSEVHLILRPSNT